MINNNFKTALLIPMLLFILGISSCNKDSAIQQETGEKIQDVDAGRLQKIKRFISITWNVELENVKYNEAEQNFVFQNLEMTREEIENLYAISNEYKLKYE